jgi:hypothetical protein
MIPAESYDVQQSDINICLYRQGLPGKVVISLL